MPTTKFALWQATIPFKCTLENGRPAIKRAKSYSPLKNISTETNLSRSGSFRIPLPLTFSISAGLTGRWGVIVDPIGSLTSTSLSDGTAVFKGAMDAYWYKKTSWGFTVRFSGIGIGTSIPTGTTLMAKGSSKKYTVKCKCNQETGKLEIDITLAP